MKKVMYFIGVIVASLLFLNACGQTDNWRSVNIEGYGSIQAPEDWEVCTVDEFMYLYSKEDNDRANILVQYRSGEKVNEYFADIENMIWLQDENLSNGASVIKYHIDYQSGYSKEMFVLYFTGPDDYKSTEFLCMDDTISEDTLREIAKSYNIAKTD